MTNIVAFPTDKKYNIIYADPPWEYGNKVFRKFRANKNAGSALYHYDTMKLDDIMNIPVNDIADENCILFMWATFPNLPQALEVIKVWGFEYKTLGFSWIKKNKDQGYFFGIGHYTKSNCEVCLIAVKGKPKIISNKVSSVHVSTIEKHSKKPDAIREKIVQLCGDLPRIELFARTKIHGWDTWGNDEKLDAKPLEVFF